MTHLFLAPAGGGKTRHCIGRIREVRHEDPLAPIWVVQPGKVQAADFRRRLARAGGGLNVHVGTFYDLYAEILAQAGEHVARLQEPVRYRLLRTVVDELSTEATLQYYAPLRDRPGFFRALRTTIEDFKRARARSQEVLDAVTGHGRRLEELATIYLRYQRRLYDSPWADAEGQGWLADLALEAHPGLCAG